MDEDYIPYHEPNVELFDDRIEIGMLIEFCKRHALKEKKWVLRNKGEPVFVFNFFCCDLIAT